MKIRLEFKWQNMWIGVYWNTKKLQIGPSTYYSYFDMWICLIPMIPIHISNMKEKEYKIWE